MDSHLKASRSENNSKTMNIMVFEESTWFSAGLRRLLETGSSNENAYRIIYRDSLNERESLEIERHCDLLIVDLETLPKVGMHAISIALRAFRPIPVICLISPDDRNYANGLLHLGITCYDCKPVPVHTLADKCRKVREGVTKNCSRFLS